MILTKAKEWDERLFYILFAADNKLTGEDLVNVLVNDTVKFSQLTERQRKIYEIIKKGVKNDTINDTINDLVNVPVNVPVNARHYQSH